MSRIPTLRNLILRAKHAYYYSDAPLMSDAEFDSLEDELRLLSPNDSVLAIVGSPVPSDTILTKARHSMPMGSQNKVKSEAEFRDWWAKNDIRRIHASLKGDGGSGGGYYRDGKLHQAISRGDGLVGEDLTANAIRFIGLPAWCGDSTRGFTGSVRFEVILTVENWAKVDPEKSKNPRNVGNGIMGRKNGSQCELLTAYAFGIDEIIDGVPVQWKSEEEKTARLVELGFNVIENKCFDDVEDVVSYFREIAEQRGSLPFWIDGLVLKIDDIEKQNALGVVSDCPKGQIAWKFDSSGAESVLESVVVSGGHTGGLYPTAKFRPVEIGGTTVSSASLANYEEIQRLGIEIGDSIWVIKANDIIPKIIRVTDRPSTRTPIAIPTCCPFCGGEVGKKQKSSGEDGVVMVCKNPQCEKKSTGKIGRWISSLDILGIGDALLEALIERFDLEDVSGLYTLHQRRVELGQLVTNVDRDLRLGDKRATSILEAIEAKRHLTLSQFLGSLGLESLGKRRVELMIKAAGGSLSRLEDWRTGKLYSEEFSAQVGVPNLGTQIQSGIDSMGKVIDALLAAGVTIADPVVSQVTDTEQRSVKTVCISGSLPSGKKKAAYKEPLLAAGYELLDDVVKGLNYLVLAEPDSVSGKAQKARKLGIEIISEDQLVALVANAT